MSTQIEITDWKARAEKAEAQVIELKGQVQFYLDGCAKAEKISGAHINRAETAEARVETLEKALAEARDRITELEYRGMSHSITLGQVDATTLRVRDIPAHRV